MKTPIFALIPLAIVIAATCGCKQSVVEADGSDTSGITTHVHRHGPVLNGEMFDFDSDYAAEAQHVKGENIIRIAILDGEGKKLARVKTDSITVRRVDVTEKNEREFTLTTSPDDEATEDGSYLFELDDEDFALAWSLGIEVEMTVGGKVYKGILPAFQPH